MNVYKKIAPALIVITFVIAFSVIAHAGDLEPPAEPEPTMKTLDEIYSLTSSIGCAGGSMQAGDGRWVIAMRIGEYPGSWDYEGEEDSSKVIDLHDSFSKPFNPESGGITGAKVLDSITITKNIDKATPGLGKAFDTGQVLQTVILRFYWEDPQGQKQVYFILTLNNARVVGFGQRMTYRGNDEYVHLDEISFIYETLQWNWIPDSIDETIQWYGGPPE